MDDDTYSVLSGMKVINDTGTFYFSEPGNWIGEDGWPIEEGKFHRTDGPAIEQADGSKAWFINGKLHREDGPAIEQADGSKHWWVDGKRHREDGPAVEYADGSKYWYVNGEVLTEEEFNEWRKQNGR